MVEIRQTETYARWFSGLRDRQARARINVRIRRLSLGNPGDVRPVGFSGARPWSSCWPAGIRRRRSGISRRHTSWREAFREHMEKTQTTSWDVVEHLETEEDMAAYLEAAFEDGDAQLVAAALGDIARAKGMSQVARDTGLGRESLYKALSADGNPAFGTVLKVVEALGLRLHATPR